jgi:hypothetical protein
MSKILLSLVLSLVYISAIAQKPADQKDLIKQMCGCYEIDFQYAETFSESDDYQFHDRYSAQGLEWVFVAEEQAEEIVIQHLLIINDSTIIKHWREDWLFENRDLLVYERNFEWSKRQLTKKEAAGTWSQKVYQVDDSPRYQGHATWLTADGKQYWESTSAAPLPRREYTKRSDYNVMLRTNKHKLTDFGHVHELDNAKLIRSANKDSVLVWEKGMNTYTKVDDDRCLPAKEWWPENQQYWSDVRAVWSEVIAEKNYINLEINLGNQKLWQRLFALSDEAAVTEDYDSTLYRTQVSLIINEHLSTKPSAWVNVSTKD